MKPDEVGEQHTDLAFFAAQAGQLRAVLETLGQLGRDVRAEQLVGAVQLVSRPLQQRHLLGRGPLPPEPVEDR